jgi:hypothetical protein
MNDTNRPTAAPSPAALAIAAIVSAATNWGSERTVNDWDEAELMKAIATYHGNWQGCEECDHDCDEPCMPHTVADVHLAIDSRIAQLVHDGTLRAHIGYTPPAGWRPVAMPRTRSRRMAVTVNDELTPSFCDTLDGTKWRRLAAFRDVSAERNRQDEQWGGPAHDDEHGPTDWALYIYRQIAKINNPSPTDPAARATLVKIAALAIAGVESLDRIENQSKGKA